MLNKKSLAIALMGLGLAGSCLADTVSSDTLVNFKATVKAAACTFTVTKEGTTEANNINLGEVTKGDAYPEAKMVFNVACAGGNATFGTVTISGNKGAAVASNKSVSDNAKFAFYNKAGGNEPWSADSESVTLTTQGSFDKYVRFEFDNTAETGDHTAEVTYTATYK